MPDITFVTAWDQAFSSMAFTMSYKEAYCRRHGYRLLSGQVLISDGAWTKVAPIRRALETSEWVFWLDLDTVIMNPEVKIESFIDLLKPEQDLAAAADVNGFCAGALLLRSTSWSRHIMRRLDSPVVREHFKNHCFREQAALHRLIAPCPGKWTTVPQRLFGAYQYAEHYPQYSYPEGQYQEGDFLIHVPGKPNEERAKILRDILFAQ